MERLWKIFVQVNDIKYTFSEGKSAALCWVSHGALFLNCLCRFDLLSWYHSLHLSPLPPSPHPDLLLSPHMHVRMRAHPHPPTLEVWLAGLERRLSEKQLVVGICQLHSTSVVGAGAVVTVVVGESQALTITLGTILSLLLTPLYRWAMQKLRACLKAISPVSGRGGCSLSMRPVELMPKVPHYIAPCLFMLCAQSIEACPYSTCHIIADLPGFPGLPYSPLLF